MMKDLQLENADYQHLVSQISDTFVQGQQRAVLAVNSYLVETYWKIGQYIVEYEQGGIGKAKYGKRLLEQLSEDLSILHGKGFGVSNIYRMRQFYLAYPILAKPSQELERILAEPSQELEEICAKPSHKLSWSHYVELLKIDDPLERSFYEQQTLIENWSIPELQRQKKASLYLRLAASKDKEGILKLAKEGQKIAHPADIIREPYILDFLQIPEPYQMSETEIETRIISQYAMHNISSQLFVSKYQLYLPSEEELKKVIGKSISTQLHSDENIKSEN